VDHSEKWIEVVSSPTHSVRSSEPGLRRACSCVIEKLRKLCSNAICKKRKNERLAFEVWEKDISDLPPGYQDITCHMIFAVKMGERLRRKTLFVGDEFKTSVRVVLTIAAFKNDLDVLVCDIQIYLWTDYSKVFGLELELSGAPTPAFRASPAERCDSAAFRATLA
jgi:hypothetical protein